MIPKLAESWYLNFNADLSFHVVMTRRDLQDANFPDITKNRR